MQPSHRVLVVDDLESLHDDYRKVLAPPAPVDAGLLDLEAELFGARSSEAPAATGVGYRIDDAYQGDEAVALVRAATEAGEPYAVVFLDVRMPPGMDGVETAGHLWAIDPQLQIVLCTAYTDYSWEQTVDALAAHRDKLLVLKKPFDAAEVRQLARVSSGKQLRGRAAQRRQLGLEEEVARRVAHVSEAERKRAREVDERERAERELVDARKLEATGQLAAGIAHEINTPIQFVGDHMSFLGEGLGDLMAHLSAAATGLSAHGALSAELGDMLEELDLEELEAELPEAVARGRAGLEEIASLIRALKELAHEGSSEGSCLRRSVEIVHRVTRGKMAVLYDVELETSSDDGRAGCSQGDANLIVASAFECFANAADDSQRRTLTVRCASSDGAETLTLCAGGDLELPVDRVLSLEGKVSRRGGTLRRDPGRLAVSFPRLSEVAS